jgi:hypothetical protein
MIQERNKHDSEIDKTRQRFRDSLLKIEKELDKVNRDDDKNGREHEDCLGE